MAKLKVGDRVRVTVYGRRSRGKGSITAITPDPTHGVLLGVFEVALDNYDAAYYGCYPCSMDELSLLHPLELLGEQAP